MSVTKRPLRAAALHQLLTSSASKGPNIHDHTNLPTIVAGGAAGVMKGGRHLWTKKVTPLANVHLTLLEKVGVRLDTFADSTGLYEPLSM